MNVLIIDNYDSFTWNLVHLITEILGDHPTVIMNDSPGWNIRQLDYFDCVVITPGPGHPANDQDFGICRSIVEQGSVPVLGVCLGHQGICISAEATVDLAPTPMHGRVSKVIHSGRDLLYGIPSPFRVVRYHSLAVTGITSELEPLGFSEDGVLMAVKHMKKPQWGVQFHPESIQTEYGDVILRNFFTLAGKHCRRDSSQEQRKSYVGQDANARKIVSSEIFPTKRLDILIEKFRSNADDEISFERLYLHSNYAFWLDSSRHNASNSRYSFMGDARGPHARIIFCDAVSGTVTVQTGSGETTVKSSFFDWLDKDLRQLDKVQSDLPFDFVFGWVGYLGYELKVECGGEKAHKSEIPDAAMIFADRIIVFDHIEREIFLLVLYDPETKDSAQQWIRETKAAIREIETRHPCMKYENLLAPCEEFALRHNSQSYLQLIRQSQKLLKLGESYEICLTNMLHARPPSDPWETYRKLRRNNPVPFGALLRINDLWVLSSSPERFLQISESGKIESKPIKGTRPRGSDGVLDRSYAEDLRNSEKERAENLMIVDLVRNDLGKCAEIGTVRVPKLFDIESYATVHQMVSTVQAQLRSDCSVVDCVRAAFPGGSMTGAPKVRTMQIIDKLEGGARGVYSGALGYFSLSGPVDLSIVIRTLIMTPKEITYGIGGAITVLSDPDDELEETAVKATPLLRLTGTKFPGLENHTASDSSTEKLNN